MTTKNNNQENKENKTVIFKDFSSKKTIAKFTSDIWFVVRNLLIMYDHKDCFLCEIDLSDKSIKINNKGEYVVFE